jgi:hypothetical protein
MPEPELVVNEAQLRELEKPNFGSSTPRSSILAASLRWAWAQHNATLETCFEHGFERGRLEYRLEHNAEVLRIERLRKSDRVASRNIIIAALACAFVIMTAFAFAEHSQRIRDVAGLVQDVATVKQHYRESLAYEQHISDELASELAVLQYKETDELDELEYLRKQRAILLPYIDSGRLAIVENP